MPTAASSTPALNREVREAGKAALTRRRRIKRWLWPILPAVLLVGYLYPVVGLVMLLCMGAAVGVSFFRGRLWCDVCPRGAFYDLVVKRLKVKRRIPRFVRTVWFRLFMMGVFMTIVAVRLSAAWGDVAAMGRVFFMILAITTVVGLAFSVFFNPRSWCSFCPMGSMAYFFGRGKYAMTVSDDLCNDCGACAKVCPMELDPASYRSAGTMAHGDCLKCHACTAGCAKGALALG